MKKSYNATERSSARQAQADRKRNTGLEQLQLKSIDSVAEMRGVQSEALVYEVNLYSDCNPIRERILNRLRVEDIRQTDLAAIVC